MMLQNWAPFIPSPPAPPRPHLSQKDPHRKAIQWSLEPTGGCSHVEEWYVALTEALGKGITETSWQTSSPTSECGAVSEASSQCSLSPWGQPMG